MGSEKQDQAVFKDKSIILGAGGSIAAYKLPLIVSLLVKRGAQVHCAITPGAAKFVSCEALATMSRHRVWLDSFDEAPEGFIPHVDLADRADLLLIAPASAGLIARLAHGLADDMLCCMALAARCPKLIVPAMNVHMFENAATQANLNLLSERGWTVMEPDSGLLACGYVGRGKMPEPQAVLDWAAACLEQVGSSAAPRINEPVEAGRANLEEKCTHKQDMKGQRVVITAGPTREKIDPVRYITNHSSGKMGYALAAAAQARGAEVTLISGPVSLAVPDSVECISLHSAAEMAEAVQTALPDCDCLIMAAAVADFTPAKPVDYKIKKDHLPLQVKAASVPQVAEEMTAVQATLVPDEKAVAEPEWNLPLKRTCDILSVVAQKRRPEQLICGFAMETENLEANARKKLREKKLDMICANSLNEAGAGFGVDSNILTLIGKDFCEPLPLMSKRDAADRILDKLQQLRKI